MHSRGPSFFVFWRRVRVFGFLLFSMFSWKFSLSIHEVPIEFLTCSPNSQCVPNMLAPQSIPHILCLEFHFCHLYKNPKLSLVFNSCVHFSNMWCVFINKALWVLMKRGRLQHIYFDTVQKLYYSIFLGWANQRFTSQKRKNWTFGGPHN